MHSLYLSLSLKSFNPTSSFPSSVNLSVKFSGGDAKLTSLRIPSTSKY
uniref:Uncharacterized protein n=1 Tax=Manihot esculenta TaxID=3983 RepID=A0A2C9UHY6_MANES